MITRVSSYQTQDGHLYADKKEALAHNLKIDIAKILKASQPPSQHASTPELFASGIVKQSKYLYDVLQKYHRALSSSERKK